MQPQTIKDYSRLKLHDILNEPANKDFIVIYYDTKTQSVKFQADFASMVLMTGMLHLMAKLVDDMALFPEDYQEEPDNTPKDGE